ncbi:MAG: (E)-4-hydroxy-3-methylbut-2-enyl-diphosphate synthase [Treponema sp.]|nr:(E)-4-hydroxy-3-methylbut-2-enyl-diphosphate synthase [Treponema sp.]
MKQDKKTKIIKIGGFAHIRPVFIGGDNPVTVQTMYKDRLDFSGIDAAAAKIQTLQALGCSLVRFAVPDMQSAEVLGALSQNTPVPLSADIHFDHKIALRCLDFPIAKIRINPGNIGGREKVRDVLDKAASGGIPIRIGVNAGSLPPDLRRRVDGEEGKTLGLSEALVQAARRETEIFEELGFTNYLVSMKASTIADTIRANCIFSGHSDSPLHIGVTEAGPLAAGIARNSAAMSALLKEGIGDTIRVSLSDTMESEIIAGREILKAAFELSPENKRLKAGGVSIVSCPRCGRSGFDTHSFLERWAQKLYSINRDATIAVMGCEVNGPEEAKHASLGITGAGDKVLIFKHGKAVKMIDAGCADKIFEEELKDL